MLAMFVLAASLAVLGFALVSMSGRFAPPPAKAAPEEGHALADSAAAAVEDVAGSFLGVNAHPTAPEALRRRVP